MSLFDKDIAIHES